MWSEYDWQVLVVDDELPQGDDDSSSLLEETFAIPMKVQLVQFLLDTIMLTHPDGVLRRQTRPLVYTTVACSIHNNVNSSVLAQHAISSCRTYASSMTSHLSARL